jgi:protein-S-isoprenylcysteine O-methyltransferase Ste14
MFSRLNRRLKKINLKHIFLLLIFSAILYLARPQVIYFCAGLGLVIIGEIIRIWATGHLEKNKLLTTSGPYGFIKNPMYVGTFLIMLGFAAMAINCSNAYYLSALLGIQILGFLFYYVPYKRRIEGARLLEKFGPTYADYDKNVPDYIPRRLRPYQGPGSDKRWSKAVFAENNESQVALSVILGVLILTARFWI